VTAEIVGRVLVVSARRWHFVGDHGAGVHQALSFADRLGSCDCSTSMMRSVETSLLYQDKLDLLVEGDVEQRCVEQYFGLAHKKKKRLSEVRKGEPISRTKECTNVYVISFPRSCVVMRSSRGACCATSRYILGALLFLSM